MARTVSIAIVLGVLAGFQAPARATPLGTAFTYQGRLLDGGAPANAEDGYDMQFRLWSHPTETSGAYLVGENCRDNVPVVDGLFTVELDFGPAAFDGQERWLEIRLVPAEPLGDDGCLGAALYTVLSPRQPLTATPYSLQTRGIVVDAADNVGIGTATPGAKVHVVGDLRADGRAAFGNEGIFGADSVFERVFDFTHRVTDFQTSAPFWNPFHTEVFADPAVVSTKPFVGHRLTTRTGVGNSLSFGFVGGCDVTSVHSGTGVVDDLRGLAVFTTAAGPVTKQVGAYLSSDAISAAVIGDNRAVQISSGHRSAGGSITNNHALYIQTPSRSSPLTNHYGIYIQNQGAPISFPTSYAIYSDGGQHYFKDAVGIGTATPTATLHVAGGVGDLRLDANDNAASYFMIEDRQPTQARLNKYNGAGTVLMDFNPMPSDGISSAVVRFFRETNTTGGKTVDFLRGDNTTATSASIGVNGANSYFQVHGGSVGIGTATPTSSARLDVRSSNYAAIFALSTDSFLGYGLRAETEAPNGAGVDGYATSNTGNTIGVAGRSDSPTGIGVRGYAFANSGTTYGVYGVVDSGNGRGVYGRTVALAGTNYGVYGESGSTAGRGVYGDSTAASGVCYGVYGASDSTGGRAVYGQANATSGITYGVRGLNNNASGYAVHAGGNLGCTGTKAFVIDHPFDPENKYLKHYCAEGPEPLNVYSGSVRLDATGRATIELPYYFSEINRDARIQLTPAGAAMPGLHASEDVVDNAFVIAGGLPGGKVFWEVKAVRDDLWVRTHGAPVEVDKVDTERGKYQHPALYGKPPEMAVDYHPKSEPVPVVPPTR